MNAPYPLKPIKTFVAGAAAWYNVLYFNHFMLNKDNQDLEGIYSLKLVTAESEKDESNPGLDSDERKVIGIYNPEWD